MGGGQMNSLIFAMYADEIFHMSSQHKIAPTVSSDYEIFKGLSHTALAIFVILTPHLKNPTNIQWKGKLSELKNHIEGISKAVTNLVFDYALM